MRIGLVHKTGNWGYGDVWLANCTEWIHQRVRQIGSGPMAGVSVLCLAGSRQFGYCLSRNVEEILMTAIRLSCLSVSSLLDGYQCLHGSGYYGVEALPLLS